MTTLNQSPTPSSGDDAWLEKMLSENTSSYIDDAGFTARVVASLPPARARVERRRSLLIIGGAFVGCAIAWALGGTDFRPLIAQAVDGATSLGSTAMLNNQAALTIMASASFLIAGATAWWALARSRE